MISRRILLPLRLGVSPLPNNGASVSSYSRVFLGKRACGEHDLLGSLLAVQHLHGRIDGLGPAGRVQEVAARMPSDR